MKATLALALSVFSYANACDLIAHAGGGIGGLAYTNSMEAISSSVGQGFKYVEIDLAPSSDNEWFCIHDLSEIDGLRFNMDGRLKWLARLFDRYILQWPSKYLDNIRFTSWFGAPSSTIKNELKIESSAKSLNRCSLAQLNNFLRSNNRVYIITDTKYSNISLLTELSKLSSRNFIPQVYSYNEYEIAKRHKFDRIIFTLYKQGSYKDVSRIFNDPSLFAITFPVEWYTHNKKSSMHPDNGLRGYAGRLFVHTINTPSHFAASLIPSGIYTDFLVPSTTFNGSCQAE